ncbi:MAG: Gfo/Idh/MocA family oxidoreductase [Candidatus Eisenbacteria bacterium]
MNRYRVALFGTSFARLVQAPGFQRHPGFEVVAIAGSHREKTQRVANELGIAAAYSDWRELLEREKPDLVSIVTPADLHHPMMLAAIAAGAHVHCEKPTAMHRWQAFEMRDAAVAAGKVAGINHEFRFLPARRYAIELVEKGGIGRLRRGEILGRYPLWTTPASRGMTWLSDAARGGGILGALGSHHTDCLRTFFGEPRTALASVRVDQPRRGPTADGGATGIATADDAFTVHYEFDHGATAIMDLSAHAPYRFERYEIHGEEASLRWDESGYALWRLVAGHEPELLAIPAVHQIERVEGDPALVAPFRVMVDRLHGAIDSREPLTPSFAQDAVPVQCALDACRASSAAGTRVQVIQESLLAS